MSLDGLSDIDDVSSRSSGSSSSTSGGKTEELRVPYMVIFTDEDGETRCKHSPQDEDLMLQFTRDSTDDRWELAHTPEYFERYWMDQSSFRRAKHIVKEVTGSDLRQLLSRDPEKGLNAIVESSKVYNTDRDLPDSRNCAVCGDELHVVYDRYDSLNGQWVCDGHTLGEIRKAGVLNDDHRPTNRRWE